MGIEASCVLGMLGFIIYQLIDNSSRMKVAGLSHHIQHLVLISLLSGI